jgi:uncharacterized membrane protein YgcG
LECVEKKTEAAHRSSACDEPSSWARTLSYAMATVAVSLVLVLGPFGTATGTGSRSDSSVVTMSRPLVMTVQAKVTNNDRAFEISLASYHRAASKPGARGQQHSDPGGSGGGDAGSGIGPWLLPLAGTLACLLFGICF